MDETADDRRLSSDRQAYPFHCYFRFDTYLLLPASPSPLVAHLGTRKISSARLSCSPAFVEELLQEACDSTLQVQMI